MCAQSEKRLLQKRKRKAWFTNVAYHILRIFPIDKKKIVFTTFEGDGGYCCNPRYIAEELLKKKELYHIVWLVNNMDREFPEGIRKVKNTFFRRAYHLTTAKVWVDNSRKAYGTAKRKNQLYIQTWHASLGFKPVGKFRGSLFPKIAYLVSEHDSKLVDYVLSNSEWCTNLYPEMLLYEGEIIKTGSPRCDILMNKRLELYQGIRERYNIPQEAKIVMYAPTFRGGSQKGKRQVFAEEPTIDFERIISVLQKKMGGEWYVFLRLHPQLSAQLREMPLRKKAKYIIDVSQADDMNEVLAAADVFITDYSSTAFDAIYMYMPVFLYADDYQEYIKERGELMWDMYNLPFSFAENNEALCQNIENYNENIYKANVTRFLEEQGVLEDGHASERVVEVIENHLL